MLIGVDVQAVWVARLQAENTRLRAEARELASALEDDLNSGETKVSLRTLNAMRAIQSRDEQSVPRTIEDPSGPDG